VVEIDCTFPAGREGALREGLERIRAEAEDAVRSGAGHLILTDQAWGPTSVAMPMILATSAVHSWLTRKGLRTFCSLNVRSAECIDPHYFAVLIGCGATTVNAYLARGQPADRIERGLLTGTLTEAVARYREAIDQGLLKIMSKMGISVISSYRGGLNFEAVGSAARWWRSTSPACQPHLRHRRSAACRRRRGGARQAFLRGRTCCPSAASTRRAAGETHAWEAQT
jgi:glutamate synthase (NADPH/NADH) large chain